jgi:hypothetical protein
MRVPSPRVRPPLWPTVALGTFTVLATLSLLQGMVDVVIPTLRGEDPFGFIYSMTERFGPGFFIAYIFVHNLGLASVVPGFGFLAAWFERRTANRFLVGLILLGAVVTALFVAMQFILTARGDFHLPLSLALLLGEACGVLLLAVAAVRELKGFLPTRTYGWSLVTPFRRLKVPFASSAIILLVMSVWEAYAILGL